MKKVTRKEYEQELNQLYSEVYDEQFLIDHFIYMTVKTSINESRAQHQISVRRFTTERWVS